MFKLSKYTIEIAHSKDGVILFNSFTGSVVKLEWTMYEKIKNVLFDRDIIPCFDSLAEQGFIVHSSTDEYGKLQLLLRNSLSKDNPTNLSYVIAPTLNCNFKCYYCFENNTFNKTAMTSSTMNEVIRFIVNQVKKISTIKKVTITWFGGEPMLEFNLILDFCESLKKELTLFNIELECHMVTNGSLLTFPKAKILADKCNLTTVQVTLDGTEKLYAEKKGTTTETYFTVIKNISDCCNLFKINVRLNTDKTNFDENIKLTKYLYHDLALLNKVKIYLAEIRNYCNDSSLHENFYEYGEFNFEKDRFNDFIFKEKFSDHKTRIMPPIFSPNFCNLMKLHNFAIDSEGYLYKCEHYIGNKTRAVGDVRWGIYYNDEYIGAFNGNVYKECSECDLYPSCRVNCKAMREFISNGTNQCVIYDEFKKNIKKIVLSAINLNNPT